MLSTDLALSSAYADPTTSASRLIVTRRDAMDRTYRAIGYLDRQREVSGSHVYTFSYLAQVADQERFVPIIGFRDLHRHYRSTRLFPSFSERVMSAKRPDRPEYLAALDLDADADAWEILSASGGHREGDPIELVSLPSYEPTTGMTSAHFLAHGVRYCDDEASAYLTQLQRGHKLTLRFDPTNPKDANAIQVVDGSLCLGFVPSPLLDYVHSVVDSGAYELRVVRANPAETHPHLRLLLHLRGHCEDFVFDGPAWRSASDLPAK
ncbi:HIRAN domain-containing protein [Rhodococcus pyridinivorans]|uniref:HIRAN domain-containing protein n=1 Tax=Rhodococcus pyridinivorans TaxID=103816 RepID=UPI00368A0033